MAQIECKDVSLGYDGRIICRGLNFTVNRGDFLCIVGNNGSGKSTLMKVLLKLKPADRGAVFFGDGVCSHDMGYLPQAREGRGDFPASVREVVLSGCTGDSSFRFFPSREARRRAEKNMERLGVSSLAGKSFSKLSGGQQQRVLLARALCAAERLLLLDEPTSGLDPQGTEELYETIQRLNREGITVIMITHDLPAVARYATSVLSMGEEPVFYSSAREYLESASLTGGKEERHE